MTRRGTSCRLPRDRQRGAVLVVALMFLIVLTLLGLSAMTGTTLEERMAGNSRDYNTAAQAAEAALRDAEADITGSGMGFNSSGTVVARSITLAGATSFNPSCTGGLCSAATVATANAMTQIYNTAAWSTAASASYGQYTGANPIVGVSSQPRYIMELLYWGPGQPYITRLPGQSVTVNGYYIRITSRAWGANSATQVQLQEIFVAAIPTS
jgi:type IV pilus assembly protein PilX